MASTLLHPGYRSLLFVPDETHREECRSKRRAIIRRLMDQIDQRFGTTESAHSSDLNPIQGNGDGSIHMEDLMCFDKSTDCDELSTYEKETFSPEQEEDLKTNNGDIRFWVRAKNRYPCLHLVAIRCLAVPVSSMSSERDFSFINRLVTSDRSCLRDDIIEDNAFLKHFFDYEERMKNQTGSWSTS